MKNEPISFVREEVGLFGLTKETAIPVMGKNQDFGSLYQVIWPAKSLTKTSEVV